MLSVIIVNYNSGSLIQDCFESLLKIEPQVFDKFEFIIIDNSSNLADEVLITSKYPKITWKDMGYNAGFARANNYGITLANPDNDILLLNSDIVFKQDTLSVMYAAFNASSYAGYGIQLLNEDDSMQPSGHYAMRGGLNYLLPVPYIGKLMKWVADVIGVKKPHVDVATAQQSQIIVVDWIIGAFLFVKRATINKIGKLDPDFFLYAEEAEWCSRIKKTGDLAIDNQYKVYHLSGATATVAFESETNSYDHIYDKKGFQIMLSNFVRIRKQFGLFWYTVMMLGYTFAVPTMWILSPIFNLLQVKSLSYGLEQLTGFSKNALGLWKYCYVIIFKKPYFYKVL